MIQLSRIASGISLSSELLKERASPKADIGQRILTSEFRRYPGYKVQAAALSVGRVLIAVTYDQIKSCIFQGILTGQIC